MEPVDIKSLDPKAFGNYRRKALTYARPLTKGDFKARNGTIQTKEGPASFRPGDFLAIGVDGEEYPITAETMTKTKKRVTEADQEGWAFYRATNTVRALQMPEAFLVKFPNGDIEPGKPGDFLVDNGISQWIIDKDIFAASYERV